MQYRRELDGLRAVALLPVIFFHAGLSGFNGGFVGVDIFFVISGYLITSIIFSEIRDKKFTLLGFYERRARRILPALILLLFVSIIFSWFLILPKDMLDFSNSLIASLLFSSNIFFWKGFGYFNSAIDIKPLMHTWSLAIEEQYYLIFPIFVLLLWRLGLKIIFFSLMIVSVISLFLANWGSATHPMAAFYLIPFRVWEFFVGVAIVFIEIKYGQFNQKRNFLSETLTLLGLCFILYSVFSFSKNTAYPSFYTVLPTIGAALIIYFANRNTLIGKILSSRILVGIGLISYSAYLWHQPIFAFARLYFIHDLSIFILALLIFLTFLIAYFSWKYIEKPYRSKSTVVRSNFIKSLIFSFILLGLFCFSCSITDGFSNRRGANGVLLGTIDKKIEWNKGLSDKCTGDFPASKYCQTSNTPEILLWGDSYAMHLAQGIVSSNPKVAMIQYTRASCAPIFGLAHVGGEYAIAEAKNCINFNNQIRQWLPSQKSIRYVVLSSPLTPYLSKDNRLLLNDRLIDSDTAIILDQFLETLRYIESIGLTPVIISPTPSNGKNLGQCLSKSLMFGAPLMGCDFPEASILKNQVDVHNLLRKISTSYKVIWLNDFLCIRGVCRASVDGTFIYSDTGHLAKEGSSIIGKKMEFYNLIKSPRD